MMHFEVVRSGYTFVSRRMWGTAPHATVFLLAMLLSIVYLFAHAANSKAAIQLWGYGGLQRLGVFLPLMLNIAEWVHPSWILGWILVMRYDRILKGDEYKLHIRSTPDFGDRFKYSLLLHIAAISVLAELALRSVVAGWQYFVLSSSLLESIFLSVGAQAFFPDVAIPLWKTLANEVLFVIDSVLKCLMHVIILCAIYYGLQKPLTRFIYCSLAWLLIVPSEILLLSGVTKVVYDLWAQTAILTLVHTVVSITVILKYTRWEYSDEK